MENVEQQFAAILEGEQQPEPITLTLGKRTLTGVFGLGVMLNVAEGGHRVEVGYESNGVGPIEITAMLEALDKLKEDLIEKLVEMTTEVLKKQF